MQSQQLQSEVREMRDVLEPLMAVYGTQDIEVLAGHLGRNSKTLRVWRHRGEVPLSVLVQVSEETGVPRNKLIVDQPPTKAPTRPVSIAAEEPPPSSAAYLAKQVSHSRLPTGSGLQKLDPEFIMVHGYDVRASAGVGAPVHSEQAIGRFAFHRDWIRRKGLRPSSLAIVTAKGDSMEPTVRDGDILLVDISVHSTAIDGIHLIERDGDLFCKRLQPLHAGGLRVVSDNEHYLPQELTAAEAEAVRVVGRVIWVGGER